MEENASIDRLVTMAVNDRGRLCLIVFLGRWHDFAEKIVR